MVSYSVWVERGNADEYGGGCLGLSLAELLDDKHYGGSAWGNLNANTYVGTWA